MAEITEEEKEGGEGVIIRLEVNEKQIIQNVSDLFLKLKEKGNRFFPAPQHLFGLDLFLSPHRICWGFKEGRSALTAPTVETFTIRGANLKIPML